jgi:hypothetical protein
MRKYSLFFLSWITIFRVSEKKINLKRLQLRKWPRQTPHGSRISLGRAEVHHRDAYCFPNPARSWAARKILRIPLGVSLGLGRSVFCRAARPSPRPPPPTGREKNLPRPIPIPRLLGAAQKVHHRPPPKKTSASVGSAKILNGQGPEQGHAKSCQGGPGLGRGSLRPMGPWEAQVWPMGGPGLGCPSNTKKKSTLLRLRG